jgi:hypothetical protein
MGLLVYDIYFMYVILYSNIIVYNSITGIIIIMIIIECALCLLHCKETKTLPFVEDAKYTKETAQRKGYNA